MKSQIHNNGELKNLNINIESNVVESIEAMAKAAGVSVDEIVVIALKRYRSSHAELEGKAPSLD